MTQVRRSYVDGPFGQIHLRMTRPRPGRTPLVCLHATAYSSRTFVPLMEALAEHRQVFAIDTPGYGESDAPTSIVSIADYAHAVSTAIAQLVKEPVTLLGYHTGCYIGAETAISRPSLVDRIVLIGIPYFEALDREFWKSKLAARHKITDDLLQFAERWEYIVLARHADVNLAQAFEHFVDELKAWPNGWWAHESMFAYPSESRLKSVRQPALILNTQGHLASASRIAATLLPQSKIIEMSDISGPPLDTAAQRIATEIEGWLT